MAALHSALQSLGPCNYADIPGKPEELQLYLGDLFERSQLILESVPIPPPDDKLEARPRRHTTPSTASNASEILPSSARSPPASPDHVTLQKEWGRPVKLAPKDNPLAMAVYKMAGKDSRGAWFARRSVHEGIGFSRFKRSLEMEFPETLADGRAPGDGNIRGIGGDRRVEDVAISGKGRFEVFQLSAQFPGPTAPRDFVTLLVTSSNATKQHDESGQPSLSPRHYLVISKPCNHPQTQPRDGYVRGNYESLEFIREVPRRPKKVRSSMDLSRLDSENGTALKNDTQRCSTDHERGSATQSRPALKVCDNSRRRGKTVSFSESRADDIRASEDEREDRYEPELNPVEWIMVTRSDPGGSVPRFMVERGTPGSIVADASKFLDWACRTQHCEGEEDSRNSADDESHGHRRSLTSLEANGHLADISNGLSKGLATQEQRSLAKESSHGIETTSTGQPGISSNVSDALSTGSQLVLGMASGNTTPGHDGNLQRSVDGTDDDDEQSDTLSSMSFASADSHLDQELDRGFSDSSADSAAKWSASMSSTPGRSKVAAKYTSAREKEARKFHARRLVMDAKLASVRTKWQNDERPQSAKEKEILRKAEEKHGQEMKRLETKYQKEHAKLEARRQREEKRTLNRAEKEQETNQKAQGAKDRDERRRRVERERDEAREEVRKLQAERDIWRDQVGDLQRQNTALAVRMGKLEKSVQDHLRTHGQQRLAP